LKSVYKENRMDFCSTLQVKEFDADPCKRVNYTLGLVLGEDELRQEQGYFIQRRRLHNRLLHGWGTAAGLGVNLQSDRVNVSPGWAIDPQGREVRVPRNQCADLVAWLGNPTNADALRTRYPLPFPATVPLWVILGYNECPTDVVPVPGEPCRPEEECVAPSRITETYDLKLSLSEPATADADCMEALTMLLTSIEITTSTGSLTVADSIADIESAMAVIMSGGLLSPPPAIVLDPQWVPAAVELILQLWITQVQPAIEARLVENAKASGVNDYILLARLDVGLQDVFGQIKLLSASVNQTGRPLAYPTDLLYTIASTLIGKGV
jgi:hypothetical protein